MTAVGHTLLNYMGQDGKTRVAEVWGGFAHGVPHPLEPGDRAQLAAAARAIAQKIVEGRISDPTNGATHFYTPQLMTKEGEVPHSVTDGGLEDVAGVTDPKTGKHVLNYQPGWALKFDRKLVPDIPEKSFKFSNAPTGAGTE